MGPGVAKDRPGDRPLVVNDPGVNPGGRPAQPLRRAAEVLARLPLPLAGSRPQPCAAGVTWEGIRLQGGHAEERVTGAAQLAQRHRGLQDLLGAVWGTNDLPGGRDVVKSTVYRLRARLAAAGDYGGYIQTVRGVGYLVPDLPPAAAAGSATPSGE